MLVPIYTNSVGGFLVKENEFNNKAMKTGNIVNLDLFGRKVSLDVSSRWLYIVEKKQISSRLGPLQVMGEVCERGYWFIGAVSQPVDGLGWVILCSECCALQDIEQQPVASSYQTPLAPSRQCGRWKVCAGVPGVSCRMAPCLSH